MESKASKGVWGRPACPPRLSPEEKKRVSGPPPSQLGEGRPSVGLKAWAVAMATARLRRLRRLGRTASSRGVVLPSRSGAMAGGDPDFVLRYLAEVEALAEEVMATRQQVGRGAPLE